jgi:hypothetical protein
MLNQAIAIPRLITLAVNDDCWQYWSNEKSRDIQYKKVFEQQEQLPEYLQPLAITHVNINDFMDAMQQLGVFRLAKFEDELAYSYLTFCGVYRLCLHKESQKVHVEELRMNLKIIAEPVFWAKTSHIHDMPVFFNNSSYHRVFLNIVMRQMVTLFNDLVLSGMQYIQTERVSYLDARYRNIAIEEGGTFKGYSQDEEYSPIKEVDFKSLSRSLSERLLWAGKNRFSGGSRHVAKYIWLFLDKESVSLYQRIYGYTVTRDNAFKCFHQFSRLGIDKDVFKQHERWLPWLSGLPSQQLMTPNLFSYNVLLPMLRDIYVNVTKKQMRQINQLPKKLQQRVVKFVFTEELSDLSFIVSALSLMKAYPCSIQCWLFEHYSYRLAVTPSKNQGWLFILNRWCDYFISMASNVKPVKQREQWQRAINQLNDVLHWYYNNDCQLHKNQQWPALVRQEQAWIANLNEREGQSLEQLYALSWVTAEWDDSKLKQAWPTLVLTELNTGQQLHIEGCEQEHCVFSYLQDCYEGQYRVFSLNNDGERATLGLYVDHVTLQCQYDQLRGKENSLSSKTMQKIATSLIKAINKR